MLKRLSSVRRLRLTVWVFGPPLRPVGRSVSDRFVLVLGLDDIKAEIGLRET
jgi:hypothetical protein